MTRPGVLVVVLGVDADISLLPVGVVVHVDCGQRARDAGAVSENAHHLSETDVVQTHHVPQHVAHHSRSVTAAAAARHPPLNSHLYATHTYYPGSVLLRPFATKLSDRVRSQPQYNTDGRTDGRTGRQDTGLILYALRYVRV